MFDLMTLEKKFFFETILYIAQVLSNVRRLFFDNQISVVLTKFERIHGKFILLNVVSQIKIKMNWLLVLRIIFHFIAFNVNSIYSIVIGFSYTHMDYIIFGT